jgi:hypothetical protein
MLKLYICIFFCYHFFGQRGYTILYIRARKAEDKGDRYYRGMNVCLSEIPGEVHWIVVVVSDVSVSVPVKDMEESYLSPLICTNSTRWKQRHESLPPPITILTLLHLAHKWNILHNFGKDID